MIRLKYFFISLLEYLLFHVYIISIEKSNMSKRNIIMRKLALFLTKTFIVGNGFCMNDGNELAAA